MKVIGKDRTSCDVCNPIDEIIARLDALERRASAIVAKVQGIAPDGEGNVTLPTSSSDTDPLHGRIDAFAMSSEVKEAADDAHAYAASIADDVVVINSEIDALNQAVAALQPAEIEAIKAAVQSLQTTVATLESTVATLDSNVSGKVSKSGDTMTGELITMRSGWNVRTYKSTDIDATALTTADNRPYYFRALDKNNKVIGQDVIFTLSSRVTRQLKINYYNSDGTVAGSSSLTIRADPDGSGYVTAPSWPVGTNDNSDKILTIKMANSLPSLVHTTGNESISGNKTFTSLLTRVGTDPWFVVQNLKFTNGVLPSAGCGWDIQFTDKNNAQMGGIRHLQSSAGGGNTFLFTRNYNSNATATLELKVDADGKSYGKAPTTPTGATGQEIATANWVLERINELATKNGLNGL